MGLMNNACSWTRDVLDKYMIGKKLRFPSLQPAFLFQRLRIHTSHLAEKSSLENLIYYPKRHFVLSAGMT